MYISFDMFSRAITKLKTVIDTKANIGHKHKILNGDIDELSSNDLDKLSKIIINQNGSKFLADDGTYVEIDLNNVLTQDQLDKINTIVRNQNGTKYLSDDGTYKEAFVNSEEADRKLNLIVLDGDGSKCLFNDGKYYKPLTDNEKQKIDSIVIDQTGLKCLFNDGSYKDPLTSDEKKKVDAIVLNGDGSKCLFDNGIYAKPLSTIQETKINKIIINENGSRFLSNDGTYKESLTATQQDKINAIIITQNGTKFLADDGTYKEFSNLGIVNDSVISKESTFSSNYITNLLSNKANNSDLHEHSNKQWLDDITQPRFTKWEARTNVIDISGDGEGYLCNDGTYKRVDGLSNPINNDDKTSSTTALSAITAIQEMESRDDSLEATLMTEINKKQDAVLGMGLSENNYGNLDKDKVERLTLIGASDHYLASDGNYYEINNSKIDDIHRSDNTTYSSNFIQNKLANDIKNIVLPTQNDAPTMWQRTFDNVKSGQCLEMSTTLNYEITKAIIQVFKFIQGEQSVKKTFNCTESESEMFYYNKDNVVFTEFGVKVKDNYRVPVNINMDGFYESSQISKNEFIDIAGITID